jgi:hypothetical protein
MHEPERLNWRMWRRMLLPLCAAACLMAGVAGAQMSLLPPACANLSGDALDKCVRDITVPQIVPKFEVIEPPPPDPAATANCLRVTLADREFCIWRNEIVLACRNRARYPDFNACFANHIGNVAKPGVASCTREKPDMRAACAERNAVYARCLDDPLGYFLCLANKGRLPERSLKP